MRSQEIFNMTGRTAAVTLLSILLINVIPVMALPADQTNAPASLEKTKSMAEAQHEIVVLLIQKKDYEKALEEANKIFDMKWPDDQEPLLVKELSNLADQFLRSSQAPLGVRLIDRNFGRFKKSSSQAALLKEMGYLYKSLNQGDKAIEYFRKARDLEGGK
jgi:tetratricopeptide (TPR) repeat protein